MKYFTIVILIVLCTLMIILWIGYLLPVKHTATVKFTVNAEPGDVWQKLADFKNYPAWRKKLKAVEVRSENTWTETDQRNHQLAFQMTVLETASKLETKITDHGLPFGGTWTFLVLGQGKETNVTITEHGEIYNPFFRFFAKYIMGYTQTLDQYSRDLQAAFHNRRT